MKEKNETYKSTIRLEGFYWHEVVVSNQDNWYNIFFLYTNGLIYNGGALSTNELQQPNGHKSKVQNDAMKDKKQNWGVYSIKGNIIQFEKWELSSGGPMKTVIRRGHILNDTTFVITEKLNNYDRKTYQVQDTFRFREFFPKPDSTNRFIK